MGCLDALTQTWSERDIILPVLPAKSSPSSGDNEVLAIKEHTTSSYGPIVHLMSKGPRILAAFSLRTYNCLPGNGAETKMSWALEMAFCFHTPLCSPHHAVLQSSTSPLGPPFTATKAWHVGGAQQIHTEYIVELKQRRKDAHRTELAGRCGQDKDDIWPSGQHGMWEKARVKEVWLLWSSSFVP